MQEMLSVRLSALGVEQWVIDLLQEVRIETRRLGHPRVSPMFSRIADTAECDQGDSDEVRCFKDGLARLAQDQPTENAALHHALAGHDDTTDWPAVAAGLNRVARWVDDTMGD